MSVGGNQLTVRLVLDTSAFFSLEKLPQGEAYTTSGVVEEMKKYGDERIHYWQSIVTVMDPTKESLDFITRGARATGDDARLSQVDVSLLAIAKDLDAVILTDDYSIQNLARYLNIQYSPVGIEGIKELIKWRYQCTGCRNIWDKNYPECPICGHHLRSSRRSRK